MAGVGFQLRKMVTWESYTSLFRAYGYSGIIGAGAWMIATISLLLTTLYVHSEHVQALYLRQFLTTVTFLIVNSLIFSSFFQHSYTRYVSDRIFEKSMSSILPSLISVCLIVTVIFGLLCYFLVDFLFPTQSYLYRLFFSSSFILLMNIWICSNLLVGMKKHKELLLSYFLGYSALLIISYFLKESQLIGLMFSFFICQFIVYGGLILFIVREFFAEKLIDFEYYSKEKTYLSLVFVSFFLNMGTWIDKYIFWYNPGTSHAVIGIIRASHVYDLPMFIAFILMIPAFTTFVFRMESDFAIYYDYYYDAIRNGGTLREILEKRDSLVLKSTESIMDILKVQCLVLLFVYLFGERVLNYFKLPELHFYILRTDVLSATFFLILTALLNTLFYLDRRREALILAISLFILNAALTLLTLHLGVLYYGYGFCTALFLCCIGAIYYLNQDFARLEFKTFMTH